MTTSSAPAASAAASEPNMRTLRPMHMLTYPPLTGTNLITVDSDTSPGPTQAASAAASLLGGEVIVVADQLVQLFVRGFPQGLLASELKQALLPFANVLISTVILHRRGMGFFMSRTRRGPLRY